MTEEYSERIGSSRFYSDLALFDSYRNAMKWFSVIFVWKGFSWTDFYDFEVRKMWKFAQELNFCGEKFGFEVEKNEITNFTLKLLRKQEKLKFDGFEIFKKNMLWSDF